MDGMHWKEKRQKKKLGLVTISVIPGTQAVEIRKISVGGQPGQKVLETPSQPIAGSGGAHLSPQLLRKV
jgi:hypothetical protein